MIVAVSIRQWVTSFQTTRQWATYLQTARQWVTLLQTARLFQTGSKWVTSLHTAKQWLQPWVAVDIVNSASGKQKETWASNLYYVPVLDPRI